MVQGTKREAERVLAEASRGTLATAPASLTTGQYLEQWLEAVEPLSC